TSSSQRSCRSDDTACLRASGLSGPGSFDSAGMCAPSTSTGSTSRPAPHRSREFELDDVLLVLDRPPARALVQQLQPARADEDEEGARALAAPADLLEPLRPGDERDDVEEDVLAAEAVGERLEQELRRPLRVRPAIADEDLERPLWS